MLFRERGFLPPVHTTHTRTKQTKLQISVSQVNYAGLSGAENAAAADTDASDTAKDATDSADTGSADTDATDRAIEMAIKNSKPQKWPYTKFMLIGDGRAGKTAVANSISGNGKLTHNQAAALTLTSKQTLNPNPHANPSQYLRFY